jgi:hypothetical protein
MVGKKDLDRPQPQPAGTKSILRFLCFLLFKIRVYQCSSVVKHLLLQNEPNFLHDPVHSGIPLSTLQNQTTQTEIRPFFEKSPQFNP